MRGLEDISDFEPPHSLNSLDFALVDGMRIKVWRLMQTRFRLGIMRGLEDISPWWMVDFVEVICYGGAAGDVSGSYGY